ncbi:conserved Plasmodium membrane protein, unknown function [Plasmodium gallinaceum]|uniref:Uncharacterized protein n=1 Tax=Plasmodium gallinaceum TaxID=5849 RepID=A0A1J1H109_PLAGA|nr:conserved Plasmodium membrane protein, unknown function [Plasmodium gallinaceum]CRG97226.1 conserved Plasmodium membrane protein, unknown function [Plasmodium gallinaceum]
MKRVSLVFILIFLIYIKNIKNVEIKKKVFDFKHNYFKKITRQSYKGRLIYTNIRFNNTNTLKNETKKNHFSEKDIIKEKLNKIKKIKNVFNKYNIKIYRGSIKNFEIKTKQLTLYKYNLAKKYIIVIMNKWKHKIMIYMKNFKNYSNRIFYNLKKKISHQNNMFYVYVKNIPFLDKRNLAKLISYNSVNLLFLLFTFLYYKSDYIYKFLKKKYAFIGEFKNIKTEKYIKIHTLSTLFFFFYKFFILRLLFILNSYNFFSKKLYILNNLLHFIFFSYIFMFPYFLIQANWGSFYLIDTKKSKFLGSVFLFQLILIYARLIFQNNLMFMKKWTDEEFFNKEELIKNIKYNKKIDFYVNLLNQYNILKKIYIGNNKFYEIILYLHKYRYLLDIIFPINNLFYIYIAHSIFFYLNNLSFAGIYISSFSFVLLLIKAISNKVDMYFLTKHI